MNILLISAVFPPEPVVSAKLTFDIANSLSVSENVTVISPKPSRPYGFQFSAEKIHHNFKHIQVDSFICASSNIMGRFRESFSFGKHCYQYIANNYKQIDVIYANTWPLFGQYYVIKAAQKYNIPIAIHVQDIYPESLIQKNPKLHYIQNLIFLPLDKYVLRHATSIVAISDKMKQYLAKTRNIKKNKIIVVHNWQDETIFIQYKSTNNSIIEVNRPFVFMYLGNLGPVAGLDLIIESFAKANLQNCRLVIAGSGSMKKELLQKALELNATTIEFWPVPEGKVPEIQEQADVLLLPIKKGAASSSIPSKLSAYMFSKKPIIACVDEGSDTANTLNDANCGWVLPPENTNDLIQLMKEIVELPKEVLFQKGKSGFEYAIQKFSKKNNLQKIISVIKKTNKVWFIEQ